MGKYHMTVIESQKGVTEVTRWSHHMGVIGHSYSM